MFVSTEVRHGYEITGDELQAVVDTAQTRNRPVCGVLALMGNRICGDIQNTCPADDCPIDVEIKAGDKEIAQTRRAVGSFVCRLQPHCARPENVTSAVSALDFKLGEKVRAAGELADAQQHMEYADRELFPEASTPRVQVP